MPYSVLLFISRKPGTTVEEFKERFENSHMPLLREAAGPHFPLSHTRRYIHRSEGQAEGTTRNAGTPARVLVGTQADFDYDVIAELTFADEAAFQTFFQTVHSPEKAAKIIAAEETFLDRAQTRAVVLGDVAVTKKE
ncbi:EthD domain-containing protein [Hypoxylon fuscum]|nr:EthD domain-containing protein [Hypoxylon fuscum]